MSKKNTTIVNDDEVQLFLEVETILSMPPIEIAKDSAAKITLIKYLRAVREKVKEAETIGKSLSAKITGKRPAPKKVENLMNITIAETPQQ